LTLRSSKGLFETGDIDSRFTLRVKESPIISLRRKSKRLFSQAKLRLSNVTLMISEVHRFLFLVSLKKAGRSTLSVPLLTLQF